jgi:D-3-phosphoglycerate dehydrogenase / 2-oxoglutarate reductase
VIDQKQAPATQLSLQSAPARILVADPIAEDGVARLRAAGQVDVATGLPKEELIARIGDYDALVVRSETKVTADVFDAATRLRVVGRAGVGVDNIDLDAATRHGVLVLNAPTGNTLAAAEHAIAMMCALARNVAAADASMHAGRWERGRFMGFELREKTLGLLGLGKIGFEVARIAGQGLQMRVIAHDPLVTPERAEQAGVELVDLDTLVRQSDVLSVHVPLTDQTRGVLNAQRLHEMKKGARVLNVARGGIIDEAALAEALHEGHIAGAAIDVFTKEPPPPDNPLLGAPNLVLTPHLGASTVEAQLSVAKEAAQLLIDYLVRGVIGFAVNMAAVDKTELAELRLYVDLARRLGLIHAQMSQGAIQKAILHYRGDVARRSTKLITAAFAAGLLESHLDQNVNIVNAPLLAAERGIEIVEQTSSQQGDFSTLLRVDLVTDKKTYAAAGTLFGNQFLRLVQIGPYHLDAYMDGVMLLFTHKDVPGLIGFIGTLFGKHQVNIAQMTVGRQQPGGEAIAVLNLDTLPPEEALKEVKAHPQISSVSVVKLPPAGQMPPWFG